MSQLGNVKLPQRYTVADSILNEGIKEIICPTARGVVGHKV